MNARSVARLVVRPVRLWLATAALIAGSLVLGSAGCGGSSNNTGTAGTTGAAGTQGGAGSGGAGTTGSAGSGGAGSGGGGAGTTGSAGTGGAGTTGNAGSGGAGTTGTAGTGGGGAGTTGAAGSNADGGTDAPVDKPATEAGTGDGGMTMTAPGLKTLDGGLAFPAASSAPMNQSPAITWAGAPAGTLSYAWTIKDLTMNNVHFVLYDIAPTVTMLPDNLPRGAMPAMPAGAIWKSAFGGTPGYEGPGAGVGTYELQVWALKVAKLDIGNMNLNQIYNTVLPAQKLDSAKLTATGKRNGL